MISDTQNNMSPQQDIPFNPPAKLRQGRYGLQPYVSAIKSKFENRFPDNVPSNLAIDYTIKFFWKYIEEELLKEGIVSIFSVGKFHLKGMVSTRTGKFQYYPKFKFSRHYTLKLREAKGTLTEAEQREIDKKREFMGAIWDKRKEHMIRTRGRIPPRFGGILYPDGGLGEYGSSNTESLEE